MALALGIDIGGTGIKGALVDLDAGELASERVKLPTPDGGEPEAIITSVRQLADELSDLSGTALDDVAHIGVCFPAVVLRGRTMSAANVSERWIGLDADTAFSEALGRDIHFVNDADAAGYAEAVFGAARGQRGLVLMTTLGTGIGSALIYNGVLVPNSELGHLELDGRDAETGAANSAREREGLSFADWATRLTRYYGYLERLFSPDLFVIGGGISKQHEEFVPLIDVRTPIVPAALRNNAGIIGAAALATEHQR
ncbi:polyphosphate--glucose phosphotransferase [Microcella frigidaquae]|uniref:Polyphosphate glucokinase n=1 Tax=Microcella frigidaquae TaxID=424758 RepID=A0A840X602_9MICO|nr:ROK family protein [Microcella frigidaquae]MBB5616595.1 polyphosphate glucokinase [Microcella frigidaquae]NHN43963.1 ROK family protein [Microcella frigidaquae]